MTEKAGCISSVCQVLSIGTKIEEFPTKKQAVQYTAKAREFIPYLWVPETIDSDQGSLHRAGESEKKEMCVGCETRVETTLCIPSSVNQTHRKGKLYHQEKAN